MKNATLESKTLEQFFMLLQRLQENENPLSIYGELERLIQKSHLREMAAPDRLRSCKRLKALIDYTKKNAFTLPFSLLGLHGRPD